MGRLTDGYNPSKEVLSRLTDMYNNVLDTSIVQGMYAVTYLLARLLPNALDTYSIRVTIKSKGLPIGAGLGSSAAFSVALSAACCSVRLHLLFPTIPVHQDSAFSVPNSEQLEIINRWAYSAEVLLHGSPSGLDNTTSCFGGYVLFRRDPNGANNFERLSAGQLPLKLLLCNTGVPRSTKLLVSKVGSFKQSHPSVVDPIFSAINGISETFSKMLSR